MNLFYPMLVSGLLTSFHCVMMCGNMVLSYAVKGSDEGPFLRRMTPHFAYHAAKILSYAIVGLLLGSIGSFISQGARSWVSVVAGAYMILLGLQMTGKFPQLNRIQPRPPKFVMSALNALRKKSRKDAAEGESTLVTPISFGLMTGLMPCGPLIAAQVAAAGSGSTVSGGLAMLGFGLGTAPLMLAYGAVASFLGSRVKKLMAIGAAIVIIALGAVMMNRGATALGWPVNFNVVKTYVAGGGAVAVDESQFKTGADGVIEVPFTVDGYEYKPATLAIPADKPVRLIVTRIGSNVCSDELWIPKVGVRAKLTPDGVTIVDVPATASGSYQITCQMGMLSGTLQAGAGAPKRAPVPFSALVVLVVGAVGVYLNHISKGRAQGRPAQAPARGRGTRRPAQAPQPQGLFGLQPQETLLVIGAIGAAVLLGLSTGGYFS